MFQRKLVLLFVSLLFATSATAQLGPGLSKGSLNVPDSQLADWTHVGVVGGIPDTSGWGVVNYDCDGTSDRDGLGGFINLNGAGDFPNGKIVQLLANDTCDLQSDEMRITRSNVVLRGAARWKDTGQGGTRMRASGFHNAIEITGSHGSPIGVASPPVAGATQVVANTTSHGIVVGDYIEIADNVGTSGCGGGNTPTYSNYGDCGVNGANDTHGRMDVRKVTAVAGATITLDFPLRYTYGIEGGTSTHIYEWTSPQYVGIENLYFVSNIAGCNPDPPAGYNFTGVEQGINFWMRGNYFFRSPANAINLNSAAYFEVSDNVFNGHQRQSGGCDVADESTTIVISEASNGIIVNNVMADTDIFAYMIPWSNGNVIAYNHTVDPSLCANSMFGRIVQVRQGTAFNLIEGNDFEKCNTEIDSLWGSIGVGNVFYRNRTHPVPDGNLERAVFSMWGHAMVNPPIAWRKMTVIGNHMRGARLQFYSSGDCGNGFDNYASGNNADVNCHVADTWYERNVFWDPVQAAAGKYRGFVAGVRHLTNLDCGTGTGIDGCGAATDQVRGTNVQRLPAAPGGWSSDTIPASFYQPNIASQPWVCTESLAGNRIAIGAWDDNTVAYSKLPAQIRYEGGTCTAPSGGGQPVVPIPMRFRVQ